jgi:hypothetical protein
MHQTLTDTSNIEHEQHRTQHVVSYSKQWVFLTRTVDVLTTIVCVLNQTVGVLHQTAYVLNQTVFVLNQTA